MARQVTAVNRTLRALREAGRLTPEHEALVALAKGLAAAVDSEPNNASLWKEYRAAIGVLTEVGVGNDVDDDTKQFLVSIQTPPMRAALGESSE